MAGGRAPQRSVGEGRGSGRRAGRSAVGLDGSAFDLLTFDCYGTLIDWEAGILHAVGAVCADHGVVADDDAILASFARAEHRVQAERFRSYREVLARTMGRMAKSLGFDSTAADREFFAASVGDWPPFPDTADALGRLRRRYRLGIVSNVDDDLFAPTAGRLGVEFDWVVTAQQVGSYKPAPAHFEEMARRSGISRERTLHVAQSLFHDVAPASALGYATLHVDRPTRGSGSGATPPSSATPDVRVSSMAEAARVLLGDGDARAVRV